MSAFTSQIRLSLKGVRKSEGKKRRERETEGGKEGEREKRRRKKREQEQEQGELFAECIMKLNYQLVRFSSLKIKK